MGAADRLSVNNHSHMKHLRKFTSILAISALLFCITAPALSAKSEDELLKATEEIASGKKALNGPSGDTWLLAVWDWISTKAVAAWEWLYNNCHAILFAELKVTETNWVVAVILLAVLSLMILSGCLAASTAQMRRHPKTRYFFFGFFTFFVGPVWLMLNLDILGEDERKAKIAEEAAMARAEKAERERKELEQAKKSGQVFEPAVSETGVVWNQEYFRSIQRLEDGTPAGPWTVTYNSITVKVIEIIEPLAEFVHVRFINMEGHELKGRIPYHRITQWDAC